MAMPEWGQVQFVIVAHDYSNPYGAYGPFKTRADADSAVPAVQKLPGISDSVTLDVVPLVTVGELAKLLPGAHG
jgi:hypothetical protein